MVHTKIIPIVYVTKRGFHEFGSIGEDIEMNLARRQLVNWLEREFYHIKNNRYRKQ
jgi:hypothetical protein